MPELGCVGLTDLTLAKLEQFVNSHETFGFSF